jgi:hypothetical protein
VTQRKTIEEIIQIIEQSNIKLMEGETYKNWNTPIGVITKEGYKARMNIGNIKKGCNPAIVHKLNPYSYENIKLWIKINAPEYELVSDSYKSNNEELEFKHKSNSYPSFFKTWTEFTIRPQHPLIGYEKRDKKRAKDALKVKDEINEILKNPVYKGWSLADGEEYKYKNNKTKLTFINEEGYKSKRSLNVFRKLSPLELYFKTEPEMTMHNIKLYLEKNFKVEITILPNQKYTGGHDILKFNCVEHGDFEKSWHDIQGIKFGCSTCYYETLKGETHPNWDKNRTQEERELGRNIEGYNEWRFSVFERDNFTCQCCGDSSGGNLVSHHKDGYHWCKERRVDVTNGVTLCKECHEDFHSKYGKRNNTEEQYNEWKKESENRNNHIIELEEVIV